MTTTLSLSSTATSHTHRNTTTSRCRGSLCFSLQKQSNDSLVLNPFSVPPVTARNDNSVDQWSPRKCRLCHPRYVVTTSRF
ncbi:hypothetical protein I3842_09G155200 [Carya illinoinensis]|uniref:Uncharacterized protein n=1 Tax=Carya illinoinensis TaxID=32201 RepID=A0A922E5N8_CARIL|nr:hypothetical protein I3842_09G155200 [Carya illinoinensis]